MPRSFASAVVNGSADEVWGFLRDFGNLAGWVPGIEECAIEDGGPADRVGCVRKLAGPGGSVFRERLTCLDDTARAVSYEFVESPFPVREYRATLRVWPVTDGGQSFVAWEAVFDADAADERAMTKTFERGVFGPGLEALRKRFG